MASQSSLIDDQETRSRLHRLLAEQGRVALLSELKRIGVEKVGVRQKIANELSREARENIPTAAGTSDSTEFPVIFIHIGLQPYVEAAIRGTAYWHKPVIVLGDAQSMAVLSQIDGVEFVDIATYRSDPILERARNVYVHRSTNPMQLSRFALSASLF